MALEVDEAKINFKTGLNISYKKIKTNIQSTYLSSQFTDASNSINSDLSGVIGIIPSYTVLDLSFSYSDKRFKFEASINNILNDYYFTKRATGYPGPGIIPALNRNYTFTLQYIINE